MEGGGRRDEGGVRRNEEGERREEEGGRRKEGRGRRVIYKLTLLQKQCSAHTWSNTYAASHQERQ